MFKILFVCLTTITVAFAMGCEKLSAQLLNDCKNTVKDAELSMILTDLSEMKIPTDLPGKCFVSCIVKRIMTNDNKLDVTKINDAINCMRTKKIADNTIKTVEDFVNNCKSIAITEQTCGLTPVMQCFASQNKDPVKCFPKEMVECLK